ncbi:MAG: dienelactone hydrolase family protein [Oleiphilaceae bacterium]|nr:dienelactone hydrolase family protein [Oleiphilaceae bacterium]
MPLLDALVLEPPQAASHCVIWLHGLGADGHDFADVVPHLNLPAQHGVRFVFPHAPEIPVTANGGYIMRAWYDILELSVERRINREHLSDAVQNVWEWIEHQKAEGIASSNIVLAGFSQGGAVAYQAALNYAEPLAGLLALSTYIADYEALTHHPANAQLPILVQHGDFDPVVLQAQGQKAFKHIQTHGYPANWQSYHTEHHLCAEQIDDISQWLHERLAI